jgi:carbamoyltransferase|tara:strand:- start:329 stop:1909 length:1581 start_codon:yes stop_codon:yes gene_type:complete
MRVLGISPSHDGSVCVYTDGKIEFFAKEERFTRIKRDSFPFLALEKAHDLFKQTVDYATYCWSPPECEKFNSFNAYVIKKFKIPITFSDNLIPHHRTHAVMTFYNSPFKESLVFVIDRNGSFNYSPGEREAESVYLCSYPYTFKPIYQNYCTDKTFGVVKVYEAATTLMGQHSLENGKAMGLAAYGENLKYKKLFKGSIPLHENFEDINNKLQKERTTIFKGLQPAIASVITPKNYQFYANKCRHVQLETQEAVLSLIKKFSSETGIKNICLTGGYGFNVVANNFYIKNLPECNFYIEPTADDAGTSIGAAMLLYRIVTKDPNIYPLSNNFYHFYENCYNRYGSAATITDLCNILKNQKILGLFEGAPEAGPRALGHRSLLFDPRNKKGKDIVNTLKKREWYRPFAGVILKEEFANYFETLGLKESPYMTINFKCKLKMKKEFPAIVHVDGTCRVQTVSEGFLYTLLKAFYKKTGCPFLLNTSMNRAGAPLVQTKTEAIEFLKEANNTNFGGIYFVDDKTLFRKGG